MNTLLPLLNIAGAVVGAAAAALSLADAIVRRRVGRSQTTRARRR